MRDIHTDLTAEQASFSYSGAYKVVLSKAGETDVTYYLDDDNTSKIKYAKPHEEPWSQTITLRLDNTDKHFESNDYEGWTLTISYGAVCTGDVKRYSPAAPLTVISQTTQSSPNGLYAELEAIGAFDIMAIDGANASYLPETTDTETIKDLLTSIAGATLACFNHCQAYTITWDAGYDDGIIDSYQPQDGFRVYENGSRLSAFRRLLDLCGCVARWEDDGTIHIFQATTTGASYDMEFKLDTADYPNWWAKATRSRIVVPNYVIVRSQPDDSPSYEGYATDPSYSDLEFREYHRARLQSNAEATSMAESILSKYQMHAQTGSGYMPIITNLEIFDYIKVDDASRSGSNATGNLGAITRVINPDEDEYSISVQFGAWLSLKKTLQELENTTDIGAYFGRLQVKDLYAENITADNIDLYLSDIQEDSYGHVLATHIEAGKIKLIDATVVDATFTLDKVPDGATYSKILTTDISAGHVLLSSVVQTTDFRTVSDAEKGVWTLKRKTFVTEPTTPYDVGDLWLDNSTLKRCTTARASGAYVAGDWTATPLDAIEDGTNFQRVATASLSASGLVLLDQVVVGTYGLVDTTAISAGKIKLSSAGIDDSYGYGFVASTEISSGKIKLTTDQDLGSQGFEIVSNATTTRIKITSSEIAGYNSGTYQFKILASDGKAYFGGGKLRLDATGVNVRNAADTTDIVSLTTSGLEIDGQFALFNDADGNLRGYVYGSPTEYRIISANSKDLTLVGADDLNLTAINDVILQPGSGDDVYVTLGSYTDGLYPTTNDYGFMGTTGYRWYTCLFQYCDAKSFTTVGSGGAIDFDQAYYIDMPRRTSDPTGVAGRKYYNTSTNKFRKYTTSWSDDA